MRERPILFSAPMVRAILEGRKTQTRREVKPQPTNPSADKAIFYPSIGAAQFLSGALSSLPVPCRYGRPGDRLWVRETHAVYERDVVYRADVVDLKEEESVTRGARRRGTKVDPWTPSIHMPRWASRINLEVTAVRVERIQEISQSDCVAEGMQESTNGFLPHVVADYRKLWGEINGAESWPANPWVWVVEFRRVTA